MTSKSVDVAKKICREFNCTSLSGMEFMIAQAIEVAYQEGVEFGKSLRPHDPIHGTVEGGAKKMGL